MRLLAAILVFLCFSVGASEPQYRAAALLETIQTFLRGGSIFKRCCIQGESADEYLQSGDFVVVDNNGTIVAEYLQNMSFQIEGATLDGFGGRGFFTDIYQNPIRMPRLMLINYASTKSVGLLGYHYALEYESPDCSGTPYTDLPSYLLGPDNGKFFVGLVQNTGGPVFPSGDASKNIVVRSTRYTGGVRIQNTLEIIPPGECVQRREYGALRRSIVVEYTPAPEILNAAYPVRLEQLP